MGAWPIGRCSLAERRSSEPAARTSLRVSLASASFGMNGMLGRPARPSTATNASLSLDVNTTRGRHGSSTRSWASSMPLRSGRPTSTSAAAGRASCTAARPCAASAAVPRTSTPMADMIRTASARKAGSSSTITTERGIRTSSSTETTERGIGTSSHRRRGTEGGEHRRLVGRCPISASGCRDRRVGSRGIAPPGRPRAASPRPDNDP